MSTPYPPQSSPEPQPPYPPQAPYTPPPAPQKKSRTWMWVVGLLVLFLVVIPLIVLGSCAALVGGAASSADHDLNQKPHKIEFRVTSSLPVSVNYGAGQGSSEEDVDEKQWSKTVDIKGWELPHVYVSPKEYGKRGTVTCEILVDGKSVSKQTAKGESPSPSCNASS